MWNRWHMLWRSSTICYGKEKVDLGRKTLGYLKIIAKIWIGHRRRAGIGNVLRLAAQIPSLLKSPWNRKWKYSFGIIIIPGRHRRIVLSKMSPCSWFTVESLMNKELFSIQAGLSCAAWTPALFQKFCIQWGGRNKIIRRWGTETFWERYFLLASNAFLPICFSGFCHPSHPHSMPANRWSWRRRILDAAN